MAVIVYLEVRAAMARAGIAPRRQDDLAGHVDTYVDAHGQHRLGTRTKPRGS